MIFNLDLSLKDEYLENYSGEKSIELVEEKNGSSFLIERINTEELVAIKNIEDLKHQYLKSGEGCVNPKDCDYILIDSEKNRLYFIDLKYGTAGSIQSINEQLNAGEKWLEHFLFCANVPKIDWESFDCFRVCFRKVRDARVSKRRSFHLRKASSGDFYYEFVGSKINYAQLDPFFLNDIESKF